ncbi:MAG: hypothetical protein R2827_05640 [Bdellovibrionales bacterium]
MRPQVEKFVNKVNGLYEVDYGDFKRKVGQYLRQLDQEEGLDAKDRLLINEIRNQVVFMGPGDVEMGRKLTLELAKKLG